VLQLEQLFLKPRAAQAIGNGLVEPVQFLGDAGQFLLIPLTLQIDRRPLTVQLLVKGADELLNMKASSASELSVTGWILRYAAIHTVSPLPGPTSPRSGSPGRRRQR
jgi:hypothetical protein